MNYQYIISFVGDPQKKMKEEMGDSDSSDEVDNTISKGNITKAPRTELLKHRHNIKEVLLSSNATPIRRYGGIGYTCCYCDEQYANAAHLKKHTLDTHEDVNAANFMKNMNMAEYVVKIDITDLQCKLCNSEIKTIELLIHHLENAHKKIFHKDINSHIMSFKFEEDLLRCGLCLNTFSKFRSLIKHMNVHYRNYICTVCDVGFVNRNSFTQHTANHKTASYKCDYCSKICSTPVKKRLHERIVHTHAEDTYKCGYCVETFKDYRKKEAHLAAAHGVTSSTPTCQACNKVFSSRKLLTVHTKRDHLMERSHKCTECEMTFFSTTGLKNHMVKHTGLKEYQCSVCLKCYGRKKTLNAHMRLHDEGKRFKCEHCGQDFVQKCSWRIHMKSKHGEIV